MEDWLLDEMADEQFILPKGKSNEQIREEIWEEINRINTQRNIPFSVKKLTIVLVASVVNNLETIFGSQTIKVIVLKILQQVYVIMAFI